MERLETRLGSSDRLQPYNAPAFVRERVQAEAASIGKRVGIIDEEHRSEFIPPCIDEWFDGALVRPQG